MIMLEAQQKWIDCVGLPVRRCNKYRARYGLPALEPAGLNGSTPISDQRKFRGLGDVVAAVTRATGIDKAVKAVAGAAGIKDCGCGARQDALNKLVPFGKAAE